MADPLIALDLTGEWKGSRVTTLQALLNEASAKVAALYSA